MLITITMYATIAALLVFIVIGLVITVQSVRTANQRIRLTEGDIGRLSFRQRVRRYEGPIRQETLFFNKPVRVGIEFISAICGFPGLGWLVSGNVLIGLVLMSIVPGFVWALFPVYAYMTKAIGVNPFATARYLPLLALVSSTGLAINQAMSKQKQGARDEV